MSSSQQGLSTKIIENARHGEQKRLSTAHDVAFLTPMKNMTIRMAANEETTALSWSFFIIRIGFVLSTLTNVP
jgi:hypothetical protein